MSTKTALKQAREQIGKKDFAEAVKSCRRILDFEPDNYNANVFLGLSLMNLGQLDEAETVYKAAVEKEAGQVLAWQGLWNLYEKKQNVEEYIRTSEKLMTMFMESDDRDKCAQTHEKLAAFIKEHGSTLQRVQVHSLILPSSPYYTFLEGRVFQPSLTLTRIVELLEPWESDTIKREIAKRRSRLGANISKINGEVRLEVFAQSKLDEYYLQLIDWTDEDEIRRATEVKVFDRAYQVLLVLPAGGQKDEKRAQVADMARGMVILHAPVELAWMIHLEWADVSDISQFDVNVLREFVALFPGNGLSKTIDAYLTSELSPFPPVPVVEGEEPRPQLSSEDILDAMLDAIADAPKSPLASRLLAAYYLHLKDYQSASETARSAMESANQLSSETGISLANTQTALMLVLGLSYVYYQTPKNHPQAKMLFEKVLGAYPDCVPALIGLGHIQREAGAVGEALDLMRQAVGVDESYIEARMEASWCEVLLENYEEGLSGLRYCLEQLEDESDSAVTRERKGECHWRIGHGIWLSKPEERGERDGAYASFITALRKNPNYAPAYTSLGVFYADVVGDEDRALRCFQKAFELDAGEVDAAERLASGFAEVRDWELVEVVARRVVSSNQKQSWPQRALGVVELNKRNYNKAIGHFQQALRGDVGDVNSWVGLGEAYSSSGRYVAASKAFKRAEQLDPGNWFAKYLFANVEKEMGNYEEAAGAFGAVLETRPGEFGVLVSLAETLVAWAWELIQNGFFARAAECAVKALETVRSVEEEKRVGSVGLWKVVGDACNVFMQVQSHADAFPLALLKELFEVKEVDAEEVIDGVAELSLEEVGDVEKAMRASVAAFKRNVKGTAGDRYAHSAAWYNLGWAEHRLATHLGVPASRDSPAVEAFKHAIKGEAKNESYWNAFGIVLGEVSPSIAQHAFIRALHLNPKSATIWTNLGTLYLIQDDLELANEVYSRAQSIDPEYVQAWVGQAFVAMALAEEDEARDLFEHAVEISGASFMTANYHFGTTVWAQLAAGKKGVRGLTSPIFALQKFVEQKPFDAYALQLQAHLLERAGDYVRASERLRKACEILEAEYEQTEDAGVLKRFVGCKADLGRCLLAVKEYEAAVEECTTALDLSANDEKTYEKARLSAHLSAGLGQYCLGALQDSLAMFQQALTEANGDPDVVVLLSKVLWAIGGEEEREVARSQLFESIEAYPEHLGSVLLLGTTALVDGNEDVRDAVLAELQDDKFSADRRKKLDPKYDVEKFLAAVAVTQGKDPKSIWMNALHVNPGSTKLWNHLAKTVPGDDGAKIREAAKNVAEKEIAVKGEELATAYEAAGEIQRGIWVAPWMHV
ncbi:TPR-like protein [Saitoella complicata NRRL Y-17804]|uniref:Superkiller protein 3 n=1 Tax=Saitoella complicata (strain BCRC 22490 / CBS 7301 / JCM 7358 / NBRC 10748 / NRRL Y-17804) TaxID=698492 RepID=A0A0E9NDT1_SAICN|nr:TPR-like protein [Saitoella complicata NRRL Y-17804]ODQ52615.1 TPR-like protein [Saitoella complicata NRRL Y-17804]GAO47565.1 hypothetical protein G7K_1768-t1 [Saitoella complicata NRRL Y-17804]